MPLHPKLYEIATCPICHNLLRLELEQERFCCDVDKKYFPIQDGIAVLFADEAIDYDVSK